MVSRSTHIRQFGKSFLAIACLIFIFLPSVAWTAQVTFQIEPKGTPGDGYRLFLRKSGESYNYNEPIWTGLQTSFTVEGLEAGVTYYFVVRSYVGDLESGDSNEVSYTAEPSAAIEPDSDRDGMADYLDVFPSDPAEWKDSDNDGIGNHADQDDDNDGMPDWWELKYGLDPLLGSERWGQR